MPTPLVERMLEVVHGTDLDMDLEITVMEELDKTPACEGEKHAEGTFGHIAQAPAAFLVYMHCPCKKGPIALCAPRVRYVWANDKFDYLLCAVCKTKEPLSEVTLVPLDMFTA